MTSDNFYSQLPVYTDFSVVSDLSKYLKLPNDWYIVAADIQNSTEAIQAGHYKAVNIVGVSVITAIRNITSSLLIPYMFGGDGASLCIPVSLVEKTKEALIATKLMAKKQFNLNLRVGIVPIDVVRNANREVLVSRYKVSDCYIQVAFSGGGIEYVDSLIKDSEKGKEYRLENTDQDSIADYSGLECRWDHVPSQHGETIALIVKALAPTLEEESKIYNEIILKIRQIYGDDKKCSPVHVGGLKLTNNNQKLGNELNVRTFNRDKVAVFKYWLILRFQNVLGWIFMTLKLNVAGIPWGNYKNELVENTDFKKFDGVLREVISGTQSQREELHHYLNEKFNKRQCVFGIHKSNSALITCMIDNRLCEHYHFVDASDGGYANAALHMKEQIKSVFC